MFAGWMDEERPTENVEVLTERAGSRPAAMAAISAAVRDHFVGAELLERMGFERAARVVRENLPTTKRTRSGDLGEVFATEYVAQRTDYRVPLKRLRYKDDREMPLRGNDVLALKRVGTRTQVLKLESKSRANLNDATVREACEALLMDDCRPKPATLAFLARILRLADRDEEALEIEDLQTRILRHDDIAHIVFMLCGNDPMPFVTTHANTQTPVRDRRFVAVRVTGHQQFIAEVFAQFDAARD